MYPFEENLKRICDSVMSMDPAVYEKLLQDCNNALKNGNKIVLSGLGKNGPVCRKVSASMLSLNINSAFLHTEEAFHGDIGMVGRDDVVIILSKSGTTPQAVQLAKLLKERGIHHLWALTFNHDNPLATIAGNNLELSLEHEGDSWNLISINSTAAMLIVLQGLAIELSQLSGITLEEFKGNHLGGGVGIFLSK